MHRCAQRFMERVSEKDVALLRDVRETLLNEADRMGSGGLLRQAEEIARLADALADLLREPE